MRLPLRSVSDQSTAKGAIRFIVINSSNNIQQHVLPYRLVQLGPRLPPALRAERLAASLTVIIPQKTKPDNQASTSRHHQEPHAAAQLPSLSNNSSKHCRPHNHICYPRAVTPTQCGDQLLLNQSTLLRSLSWYVICKCMYGGCRIRCMPCCLLH